MKTIEDFYYQASGYVLTDYFTYEQLHAADFNFAEHIAEQYEDLWDEHILNLIGEFAEAMFKGYTEGFRLALWRDNHILKCRRSEL